MAPPPKPNHYLDWKYRGEEDGCFLCGGEKLPWKEAMLCIICDNRDDGASVWFQAFAESQDPDGRS